MDTLNQILEKAPNMHGKSVDKHGSSIVAGHQSLRRAKFPPRREFQLLFLSRLVGEAKGQKEVNPTSIRAKAFKWIFKQLPSREGLNRLALLV
jgi:hypothetical protein